MKINWRLVWYGAFLWIVSFVVSSVVIVPWLYVILPAPIIFATILYFRPLGKSKKKNKDFLIFGLRLSVWWFLIFGFLDLLEIIGPYYLNFTFYYSDLRHWVKYPFVLLVPAIYGLILDNRNLKKSFKRRYRKAFDVNFPGATLKSS